MILNPSHDLEMLYLRTSTPLCSALPGEAEKHGCVVCDVEDGPHHRHEAGHEHADTVDAQLVVGCLISVALRRSEDSLV